jgi:hypothetical protein
MLLALLCLVAGWRTRTQDVPPPAGPAPRRTELVLVAAGSILIVLTLAGLARARSEEMALAGLVPVFGLLMPWTLDRMWSRGAGRTALAHGGPNAYGAMAPWLGLFPALLVFALSFWIPLLGARLFLVFVPYLLILIAAGVVALARSSVLLAVPLGIALAVTHGASVQHFQRRLTSPLDYARLARGMDARWRAGDLVFVRPRHWGVTPVFYYLHPVKFTLVARDFGPALRERPASRVWVVEFAGLPPLPEMREALRGYTEVDAVRALRSTATLYAPPRSGGD